MAACAAVLAVPTGASAGYAPGTGPPACMEPSFGQQVGTDGPDALRAGDRPERLYGAPGEDRLSGGALRASCLFGGRDADVVTLGTAGGIALGEAGADVLVGSDLNDALGGGSGPDSLAGGAGRDLLAGGRGVDAHDGGAGDDILIAEDGRAELVVCGPDADVATLDADDFPVDCEDARVAAGRPLPLRLARPLRGGRRTTFRVHLAGLGSLRASPAVVLGAGCRGGALEVLGTRPARSVREGRIAIRPPRGGWCPGVRDVVLARRTPCPVRCFAATPLAPVARVRLQVQATSSRRSAAARTRTR